MEAKTYDSQWEEAPEEPTPGGYVQKIAELSHDLGMENRLIYFKSVDEDGNREGFEGPEDEGLERLEDAVVDNVRVEYGDDDRHIVFEYDSGALGKPYSLQVAGDEALKERIESAVDQQLSESVGQKLEDKVSNFTDRVNRYLTDRHDD